MVQVVQWQDVCVGEEGEGEDTIIKPSFIVGVLGASEAFEYTEQVILHRSDVMVIRALIFITPKK